VSAISEKIAQMQIASGEKPAAASSGGGRRVSFATDEGDADQYAPGEVAPSEDESCMQPMCEVVAILSRALSRKLIVGIVVPPSHANPMLLRPLDSRLPSFAIDAAVIPDLLSSASCTMQSALLSATFHEWNHLEPRPRALLQAALGEAGAIATETAAILAMHGVGSPEFEKDVIDCLPEHPYQVPDSEVRARRDCRFARIAAAAAFSNTGISRRGHVVVSIDPSTARDLDDALHVEVLAAVNTAVAHSHDVDDRSLTTVASRLVFILQT
jgi:exoribonuclease R